MNDISPRPYSNRPLTGFDRRRFLITAAGAGAAGLLPAGSLLAQEAQPPQAQPATQPAPAPPPPQFGFENVQQIARDLAKQGYSDDKAELPQPLRNLSYDQYRDIRFKPDQALWSGQKLFQIQFFHLGFLYQQPVRINVVSGRAAGSAAVPARHVQLWRQ